MVTINADGYSEILIYFNDDDLTPNDIAACVYTFSRNTSTKLAIKQKYIKTKHGRVMEWTHHENETFYEFLNKCIMVSLFLSFFL